MDKVIKKYKNTYPDSQYYQYLEKINIPKINGDMNQEHKLLLYLLTLKRKYMYIFLNEDPKLKEYEYKKQIIFSKLGFANFNFFVLNKKPFYKKFVLYVYIYKTWYNCGFDDLDDETLVLIEDYESDDQETEV